MNIKKMFALFLMLAILPMAIQANLYEDLSIHRTWGNQNAIIDIKMFIDFEDPQTKEFQNNVFPSLFEQFGSNGIARFIHKDYPASQDTKIHEAGWCIVDFSSNLNNARRLNFWQLRADMIENQNNLTVDKIIEMVKQIESNQNIDIEGFEFCLETGMLSDFVRRDKESLKPNINKNEVILKVNNKVVPENGQIQTIVDQEVSRLSALPRLNIGESKIISNINVKLEGLDRNQATIKIDNQQVTITEFETKTITKFDGDLIIELKLEKVIRGSNSAIINLKVIRGNFIDPINPTPVPDLPPIFEDIIPFELELGQTRIVKNMIFKLVEVNHNNAQVQVRLQHRNFLDNMNVGDVIALEDEYRLELVSTNLFYDTATLHILTKPYRHLYQENYVVEEHIETSIEDTMIPSEEIAQIRIMIPGEVGSRHELTQGTVGITSGESNNACANGCQINGNCIPIGVRADGKYCDITGEMKEQQPEAATCENNYECTTNQCSSGICQDLSRQLEEQTGLLRSILSRLGFRYKTN